MRWYYHVVIFALGIFFRICTRCRIKGKENIPKKGAVIIVANHLSNADPPLISSFAGRKVMFMAKRELFRTSFKNSFMRGIGAFPVNREQIGRQALQQAFQVIQDGLILGMFPEGSRNPHKKLNHALNGSALIALRASVPIIPVGITGTEEMGRSGWILRRPKVVMNIGKPFTMPPISGKPGKEELKQCTDHIMQHIAMMLPPEYRGIYGKEKT